MFYQIFIAAGEIPAKETPIGRGRNSFMERVQKGSRVAVESIVGPIN